MSVRILTGDCRSVLASLPSESVHCILTSPPYFGLRDYGTASWEGGDPACDHKQGRNGSGRADGVVDGRGQRNRDGVGAMGGDCRRCGARRIDRQIGLEQTPDAYVAEMVAVFREARRVLRGDGTLWLNVGDSYTSGGRTSQAPDEKSAGRAMGCRPDTPQGLKPKDLIGIPWRLAFALQADGWYLRQDIIWAKPNAMPESVKDRCCKAHEYVFLLSKSARYYYDAEAIAEPAISSGEARGGGKKYSARENGAAIGGSHNLHRYGETPENRNRRSVWTIATEPFRAMQIAHRVRVEPDAQVDGKSRITSSDCPLHGGRSAQAAKGRCGEPLADSQTRNGYIGTHLARPHCGERDATGQTFGRANAEQSSDLLRRECLTSAIDHNSRSRRMGRDPETSPACMPSVRTADDSVGKLEQSALSEPRGYIDESNTELAGSAYSTSHRILSDSDDKLSEQGSSEASHSSYCTCEYYVETTEEVNHFAMMPTALAELCIKAGTSEKGCCPRCGAGWVRQMERAKPPFVEASVIDRFGNGDAGVHRKIGQAYQDWLNANPKRLIGWQPSCSCPAHEPVPATVLDCFAGAGTTGLVADRLGRNAVLIELNPANTAMAQQRLEGDAGLFADVSALQAAE
jgi:DNA modification methylase